MKAPIFGLDIKAGDSIQINVNGEAILLGDMGAPAGIVTPHDGQLWVEIIYDKEEKKEEG